MKRFILLCCACVLSSCAGLHQASFDHAFADAMIRNNTKGIFSNCNAQNARYPLNGTPPIYYAASYGNEDVIDLLYNHGASLNARSPEGRSLVYAAAANGHSGTAKKLLSLQAGTQADYVAGMAAHQRELAAEAHARKMQTAALAWLFVAMTSGGGGGGQSSGQLCRYCGKPLPSGAYGHNQGAHNDCIYAAMAR